MLQTTRAAGHAFAAAAWYIGGVAMGKEIIVGDAELRRMVRDRQGLCIEPEMSRYLLGRSAESDQPVPVFGSDARTGVPRREMVDVRNIGKERP